MLSPENFIQWTFEDFLKDAHTVPYTYFPLGAKKLKNLSNRTGQRSQGYHFNSCLISFDDAMNFDDLADWKRQYWQHNDYYRNQFDLGQHSYCFDPEKTMDNVEVIDAVLPSLSRTLIIANQFIVAKNHQTKFLYVPVLLSALITRYWFWKYRLFSAYQPQLKRLAGNYRFLCYVDNWSDRGCEYKLHFLDQLVSAQVSSAVKSYFNQYNVGQHYTAIKIGQWPSVVNQLEQHYLESANSEAESEIVIDDFNASTISIIASDYFQTTQPVIIKDIFKAIAAGHPFILLSAPGTIKQLKELGFKTFDLFWDESYDDVKNSRNRLNKIISVIKSINDLDRSEFAAMYQGIIDICDYNRQYFFSDQFEQLILDQYQDNLKSAIKTAKDISEQQPGGALFTLYSNHNVSDTAKKNFNDILCDLQGQNPKLMYQLVRENLFRQWSESQQ